ncbi:MAG: xylulokinase [Pirellulales bacterium]|nr:xylulokinase [Pirellulales bacterium]
MDVFLGIDIGTSGTKALAVNTEGAILAQAVREYPCHHPRPLWSEQDPEDWWEATCEAIRDTISQEKFDGADVRAIGLSGQMHGSVFLDSRDQVVRPALLWNDQRTTPECAEIEDRAGGRDALIRMVVNPALTGFTAPKILWLRNHEPENFERTKRVLLPKDFVRLRLTGEYATDVSDASGMLLLDVAKRRWSTELMAALELEESLFVRCFESHQPTGQLRSDVAAELGLSPKCQVAAGAGDCAAGAVGNGIVRSGLASTSIGTSGVVFVHSDEMRIDPAGRAHTFCHAVDGTWHMMGVSLSAGGTLQWFRDRLCPELASDCRDQGRSAYDALSEEAQGVPAGCDGLICLPYLAGERTPHADPKARGCFIGLTLAHTRGHMTRAIMEGVTFALRDGLEIFRELGIPIEEVRASGGGAKNELWRQMQADVFASPITTINVEEGPAYGVALLAAVAAGAHQNIQDACSAAISVTGRQSPRVEHQSSYAEAYARFQELYPTLAPSFQKL